MERKKITRYLATNYCILVPVYYENEKRPAWRKVFEGNHKECENNFSNFPDFIMATNDENRENRQNKIKEFIFLQSIGKYIEAEKIKNQYNL